MACIEIVEYGPVLHSPFPEIHASGRLSPSDNTIETDSVLGSSRGYDWTASLHLAWCNGNLIGVYSELTYKVQDFNHLSYSYSILSVVEDISS